MQTWDLQKRNRIRTGERGMIPIALPGVGVYEVIGGHVVLFILAPGGADFPEFVDWMREEGKAEDLGQEPYAEVCANLKMSWLTQVMGDPTKAGPVLPALMHIQEVVKRFLAGKTAPEAYEEGQRRRLLIGIVSTPKDLAENTQLRARDWYRKLEFDFLNRVIEFPGPPYRLSESPVQVSRPPRLGEHTGAVLSAIHG